METTIGARRGLPFGAVAVLALLAAAGCGAGGGASSGSVTGSGAGGTSTGSGASGATTSAWSFPLPSTSGSVAGGSSGSGSTSTGSGSAGSSGSGTSGSGAGVGATGSGSGSSASGSSGGAPSIAATLSGAVPPNPTTGFGGYLWLVGERIRPGSSVLVSYQGVPIKVLPGLFYSSQVLGVDVFLTIPGDYDFAALAPDGTTSTAVAMTVASGGAQGAFTLEAPSLQMVYPPSFDTSFVGTAWLLGDHFMPGATLLASYAGGPDVVLPLVFVNSQVVGWVGATPQAGDLTLRVENPTLLSSTPVTLKVATAGSSGSGGASGAPAPQLLAPPTSVGAPFLGNLKIYGQGFAVGARVELTDVASGAMTATEVLYVSPGEVWWELVYPPAGSYQAVLRNPDGQATPGWPFQVQ